MTRFNSLIIAVALLLIFGPCEAMEPGDGARADDVDEIIVTATRRPLPVSDAAFSIVALSGDAVAEAGITDLEGLWRQIPSMSFTDKGFGGKRPIVRGLNNSGINGADAPVVTQYLDDTPLTTPAQLFQQAPSFAAIDIERIEVLRGPQGTLFGSGAMGGVVRSITNRADFSKSESKIELRASDTAHGGAGLGATGVINMPVRQDVLGLRLAAYHLDDDGFIDDISLGIADKNRSIATGARIALNWRASDRLTIDAKVQHQDTELRGFAWQDPVGKPLIALGTTAPYQSVLLVDDGRDEKASLFNLVATYNAPLGSVVSSTSYMERDTDLLIDWSNEGAFLFTAYLPFHIPVEENHKMFAQEIRLVSADRGTPITWALGAFFMTDDLQGETYNRAPGLNSVIGPTGLPDGEEFLFGDRSDQSRDETGLFGNVRWSLNERLAVDAGLRWFDVHYGITSTSLGGITAAPPGTIVADSQSDNGFTGKLSLEYRVSDATMIYALVSTGFREGGWNSQNAVSDCGVPLRLGPDRMRNYEIGLRGRWLDNRLILNTTLYSVDWHDARLLVVPACLQSVLVNAPGVTSNGAEIEFNWLLASQLELSGGIGLNRATLDADVPAANAPAGRRLAMVPRVTANLGATWRTELSDAWQMSVTLDGRHVGEMTSDITEFGGLLPIGELPAYSLVNFRVALDREHWRFTVFADNVTDRLAATGCCGIVGEQTVVRPRTIGIRVAYHVE